MTTSAPSRPGKKSKSLKASSPAKSHGAAVREPAKAETSAAPRVTRGYGSGAPLVPLDLGRSSPAAGLIEQIVPVRTRADLILSAENLRLLTELAAEYQKRDTNLRHVLEAAQKRPCVLFLDEFDALARSRTESSGHGELRRVVNSLLMMIERFRGSGFLIAATNLQEMLDDAIWRRFDEVVLFEPPAAGQIRALLALKMRNFPADFDLAPQVAALDGYSYADIERVCVQAIRSAILGKRLKVTAADFKAALKSEQRRRKIRQKVVDTNR